MENLPVTVVIPAAGPSPHGHGKPVWLLTHPDGSLVIHHVLRSLDMTNVGKVLLLVHPTHVDQFCGGCLDMIRRVVGQYDGSSGLSGDGGKTSSSSSCTPGSGGDHHVEAGSGGECGGATSSEPQTKLNHLESSAGRTRPVIEVLPVEHTNSAPGTVAKGLRHFDVQGPIFIKDSDGCFQHKVRPGNYVTSLRLSSSNTSNVTNESFIADIPGKSFIEHNGGMLTNIQEKSIISDTICTGGYGFESARLFLEYYDQLQKKLEAANQFNQRLAQSRLFTSHIVFAMLVNSNVFTVERVSGFKDWKSEVGWKSYRDGYSNLLVSLEGVLLERGGHYFHTDAEPRVDHVTPVKCNIAFLQRLHAAGRTRIIIMTSRRSAEHKALTYSQLKEHDVPYDDVLFDLLNGQMHVVRDHNIELGYPSCVAHSIQSNSGDLAVTLQHRQ